MDESGEPGMGVWGAVEVAGVVAVVADEARLCCGGESGTAEVFGNAAGASGGGVTGRLLAVTGGEEREFSGSSSRLAVKS
jgi:hypothetical protein